MCCSATPGTACGKWLGFFGGSLVGAATLFGGYVALRSFVAANQAAGHSHMHEMFQQFLAARNAFAAHLARDIAVDDEEVDLREDLDFGGSVLYFLEEVFGWTVTEELLLRHWGSKLLFLSSERLRRADTIASWRATVAAHLITHRRDVRASLIDYTSCYGCDFVAFSAVVLRDAELANAAEAGLAALGSGQPRPLGRREQRQWADAAAAHHSSLFRYPAWRDRAQEIARNGGDAKDRDGTI